MSHTFATLDLTKPSFNEIKKKLADAGYQDQFIEDDGKLLIDMHGIAVTAELSKRGVQCAVCLAVFTDEQIKGVSVCPSCGTNNVPYRIGDDITITLNVLEAKVLTMWAASWCETFAKQQPDSARALSHVIDKFRKLRPEVAFTMGDEMRHLRNEFGKVEITDSEGKSKEPLL